MAKPIVAFVGRPNVGKSTLFNRLAGERISIVEDTPGVTRDRIYCDCTWNGREFMMIDTGGIEPKSDDIIFRHMRMQTQIAIDTADVIVFITELSAGLTADDREIAVMLQKCGTPVIPCVNKVDGVGDLPAEFYEFYEMGFEHDLIALSATHGSGTGDLLDKICELLPPAEEEEEEEDAIRVAVIGKPNAGKSSLINRILGEDRLIVSDIAGTTRDAIDTRVENEYGKYIFIDTAGIRRQSKVEDRVEKFSVLRAKMAIDRADVCLILIDGNAGVTEQDEKIAGLAHEAGKASIFVINKWDLVEKDNSTTRTFEKDVYTHFSYMTYAPLLFISAKTGQRVHRLFEMINAVSNQNATRISTGVLNDVLTDAIGRVQPPSDKGRYLKIYYMTQTGVKPPQFVIFCNSAELFHFSYQRYIENQLRQVFGFMGTPIKLIIRQKGDDKA
ncbi:MAG: ribosome biogenesis GTPase Der [Ruminococcaceae bacterium]|nr:ribosome biogenesis GTPase Der [Oscillospiraceae bacterium]